MVEVLAAIVILSLAILPMVSMFDAGLRAAVLGGNYDKARALANSNLEVAKVDLSEVEDSSECPVKDESVFSCDVDTSYVYLDATEADTAEFRESGPGDPDDMVRVRVTVEWDDSEYITYGVVAE